MLLSESILRVFARLLDGNPWLRALETEDLLYDAIHTRIEYGILFTKMIQEQCELRPALPHMEKNLRVHLETDMKSHMEQHRMCIESNSKQSEEMCKRFEERSVDRAKQLDKSLDLMETFTKSVNTISERTVKLFSNASLKGAHSESLVEAELVKHFCDMFVVNTTGEASSCDIQMHPTEQSPSKGRVLIEVKNYSTLLSGGQSTGEKKVPTKEVDKFIRDVKHCNPPLALMVAIGTGIVGKGHYQFERIGNTVVLYMSFASAETSVLGVSSLQEMYTLGRQMHTNSNEEYITRRDIESKLQKACGDIDCILENNTFFRETEKDIHELDKIRNKLLAKLDNHKKELSALAVDIRKRFECEIEQAAGCTVTGDSVAATPEERRQLFREAALTLQPTAPIKQERALSELMDVLGAHQLGLTRTTKGLLVMRLVGSAEAIGFIELKKSKTVLYDKGRHMQLELTLGTLSKIENMIRMCLS